MPPPAKSPCLVGTPGVGLGGWIRLAQLGRETTARAVGCVEGWGYLTGCGCDAGPSAGLGTREAPPPSRITQGGGTGVPSSGPVILQWSESRLETLVAHRVVQRTGAGGEAATCLAQPWGCSFLCPSFCKSRLPVTPPPCIHLGHSEGLWSGHRAA